MRCLVCGDPLRSNNRTGVCTRTPKCLQVYTRLYRQQTGRQCRYATGRGCTEFAAPGLTVCPEHNREQTRRNYRWQKSRIKAKLAAAQGLTCGYCLDELSDLADCNIDHVIPVALGGPDDEWNLQAVHRECDNAKGTAMTARAYELAAEHNVELGCFVILYGIGKRGKLKLAWQGRPHLPAQGIQQAMIDPEG